MQNKDLNFLKKKYGENFAKFCRSLFPSLLEKEGLLSDFITSHFAESKFLYDDIKKNDLETQFKDFVYSFFEKEEKSNKNIDVPVKLMKKAGYTLYKCETDAQVKSFRKYWEKTEELCTFRNDNKIESHLIFFAIKDNADEIKRKDFSKPLRQDDYGTSVISLQFTKSKPNILSIKNRYNHSVCNPDSTFSNDLENICAGLTESFVKEYNLNLVAPKKPFEIPEYVLASDQKYYKYNYEINNIYYCPNNFIVDLFKNQVSQLDKSKYILADYFKINLTDKEIRLVDCCVEDSFTNTPYNISNITIKKNGEEKTLILKPNIGEDVFITLDNHNRIIKYSNPNLTDVENNFLYRNKLLNELNLPNLSYADNSFLRENQSLTKLNLPSLFKVGHKFLEKNQVLTQLNLPNLSAVGANFLFQNLLLTQLNLPMLSQVGSDFLYKNESINEINLPKLYQTNSNFLYQNKSLTQLSLPNLSRTGNDFLFNNQSLGQLELSALSRVGCNFLFKNQSLTKLNLPSLLEVGSAFLEENRVLNEINLPKIPRFDNNFLYKNQFAKSNFLSKTRPDLVENQTF